MVLDSTCFVQGSGSAHDSLLRLATPSADRVGFGVSDDEYIPPVYRMSGGSSSPTPKYQS